MEQPTDPRRRSGRQTNQRLARSSPAARRVAPVGVAWSVGLALALSLVVASLLASDRLVGAAQAQGPGPARDLTMTVARAVDSVADTLRLDRPATWLDGLLGRRDEPSLVAGRPPATRLTDAAGVGPPVPTPDATSPSVEATPTMPAQPTAVPQPSPTPALAATARPVAPSTVPIPTLAPTLAPTVAPTATPAVRQLTRETPLRVHVAGDSSAELLGYELGAYAKHDELLTTQIDFKISSGLALPEYFDWPARLEQTLAAEPRPEAIILFLGANDFKIMQAGSKSLVQLTPEWKVEYGRRAAAIMDLAGKHGIALYWVGLPIVRDAWRNDVTREINAAVVEAAADRPWVHVIDTASLFADEQGKYATYRPGPNGAPVKVRQDDGTHLTRDGTRWVVALLYQELRRGWPSLPPT